VGQLGQLVLTLPEGEPVVGVTTLGNEVYLLRQKSGDQVEVYDVITYRLQRCLTVPDLVGANDMTSCERCRFLYISEHSAMCICRLDVQGAAIRWAVNDKPSGLSVNAAHNVLVTCPDVGKIKEFSSRGDIVRELTLPDDVISPWHSIQTRSGQFVVCHGLFTDTVHRVCILSEDGRHVVRWHGGQRGSDAGQYKGPVHLAVDNNEFVFVVDFNNRRVKLLSPALNYVCQVMSRDDLKWWPRRLRLDVNRRRLYVSETEITSGKFTAGHVAVFSV